MKETETPRIETTARTGRTGRRRRRMARRTAFGRSRDASGRALERFLTENSAGLTFLGLTLGVFVSRKFLILPVAVALMLAQEKLVDAGLERVRRAVRS